MHHVEVNECSLPIGDTYFLYKGLLLVPTPTVMCDLMFPPPIPYPFHLREGISFLYIELKLYISDFLSIFELKKNNTSGVYTSVPSQHL